ncbi:tRNA threonylcarbamoyladenosine biosynthesis protein TsaB [Spirosomataceae bacterium TFI 002]|nr:tRNA threonylcarbamoyladenosine biosynthesis protein TsaB [Spirosomataceae bacterium TFI 002]
MALILSIETADQGCSVALHKAGVLLGEKTELDSKSSSSLLTTLISDLFLITGKTFGDLAAVAVSKGPGSYTGLRIGVSTAKGFCYALDLPIIAINTLDGIIYANREFKGDAICPMLDARRMEVYCKMLNITNDVEELETSSVVIDMTSFGEVLKSQTVLFCGPGAVKCRDLLSMQSNAIFEEKTTQVHARNMGMLAYQAFGRGEFEDLEEFEPFYLKDFLVKKSQKKNATR